MRRCRKNMLDVCCDHTVWNQSTELYVVTWSRCCCGRLHGSVVPTKFLFVLSRCPQSLSSTRWLRYGEQSTMCITTSDTAQSERTLVRLIGTSSWQAVVMKRLFLLSPHSLRAEKDRNLLFFHPNLGLPLFMQEFLGKMESGCLMGKKAVRNLGGPVLAAHPVWMGLNKPC